MGKMSPVVHFELPYADKKRAAEFYKKAFGWENQMFGPEFGDYVVVHTDETDKNGMIQRKGAINGGLYKKTADDQVSRIVVAVEDIHKSMKQVKESGGKVLGGSKGAEKPDDIPGVGLYASIIDTEGNRVGLLQPKS